MQAELTSHRRSGRINLHNRMVIEQVCRRAVGAHTEGLIRYLETGHLDDILTKVPTGLSTAVRNCERLASVGE